MTQTIRLQHPDGQVHTFVVWRLLEEVEIALHTMRPRIAVTLRKNSITLDPQERPVLVKTVLALCLLREEDFKAQNRQVFCKRVLCELQRLLAEYDSRLTLGMQIV